MEHEDYGEYADVQGEDRQLAFNTPDVSLNHSGMKRFLSCGDDAALKKGLSHEIDFKNFDKKLHNLA